MRYYVLFSQENKAVAGTWVEASSEGQAMMDAEFKLICMCPNVKYDGMEIIERDEMIK